MEPHEKMVPGRSMVLADGETYVIAPMTFGMLREHDADINALGGQVTGTESYGRVAKLLALALGRNYDGALDEDAMNLLTLENMTEVLGAVIGTAKASTADKVVSINNAALDNPGKIMAAAR